MTSRVMLSSGKAVQVKVGTNNGMAALQYAVSGFLQSHHLMFVLISACTGFSVLNTTLAVAAGLGCGSQSSY